MTSEKRKTNWDELHKHSVSEWKKFSGVNHPCILVGSATCGRAAGSLDVIQSIRTHLKKKSIKAKIIEVGCLGFCYAEVLVEIVKSPGRRILYHSVTPKMIPKLIDDFLIRDNPRSDLALAVMEGTRIEGIPEFSKLPMMQGQVRIALRNCGHIDPRNIFHYIANGGYSGLNKALRMSRDDVIGEIKKSGLRGRGGAGFPTGMKWEFCAKSKGREKYIICNADEGDPGAFMDRSLLEGDPHSVLEGIIIGAYAIGASHGYIYTRAEYPLAIETLRAAIKEARDCGFLNNKILGSDFSFNLEIKEGAGAFVCGEETALITSIEGKRGMPRSRPPFPAQKGLYDKPTNINNVETLSNVSAIISNGGEWYAQYGTEKSRGTKTFALAGKILRTGLIEVPMGIILRRIVYDIGGGIPKQKRLKAVQIGGPSGGCLPAGMTDIRVDYESLTGAGAIMGSGGMIIMDEDTCMVDIARYFMEFTFRESCGKCAPCRLGTRQMMNILEDIVAGKGNETDIEMLEEIGEAVKLGSLCGLGQTTPNPVMTTIKYFRDEYEEHIKRHKCRAVVCKQLVIAPCKHTCPAGIDVPRYVRYIREKRFPDALAVIMEKIPLPAVCGYVCFHPCESKCRREEIDDPIAIRALKKFVSNSKNLHGQKIKINRPVTKTNRVGSSRVGSSRNKKIAVIGSGPAGLTCAYYLARLGHKTIVFESLRKPGGMLLAGIPKYRLPEKILDKEIRRIINSGVKIKTNSSVGSPKKLLSEGYNAVFVATGAYKGFRMNIPGENLPGVIDCISFLSDVNLGKKVRIGEKIGVIGGGNAAVDSARTALRLGAKEVVILYRRTQNEMPASKEEIKDMLAENVKINFLTIPKKIQHRDGKLRVEFLRMKLGSIGSDGRPRPEPINGSEFTVDFDNLIVAIGQMPDVPKSFKCKTDKRGRIEVNRDTLATSEEGIFAGGDVVTGPASVIEAIAYGRQAAVSIDRYLGGNGIIDEDIAPPEEKSVFKIREEKQPRVRVPIDTPAMAVKEASRCLCCDLEDKE